MKLIFISIAISIISVTTVMSGIFWLQMLGLLIALNGSYSLGKHYK